MLLWTWSRCWCAVLLMGTAISLATSKKVHVGSKVNSIRSPLSAELPTNPSNRSVVIEPGDTKKGKKLAQVYPCTSDKDCAEGTYCPHQGPPHCLACKRRKKRCHKDTMCCPGNRCSNYVCVPASEAVLPPRSPKLKEHKKVAAKEHSWKKNQVKTSIMKGHEGDPCLRSSDCADGHCCARHFWTKMCKPVLRQGEVCTRQRRKGSHGLELFQRCDCAKGLSCKVWTDATPASKSRLHVCQRA